MRMAQRRAEMLRHDVPVNTPRLHAFIFPSSKEGFGRVGLFPKDGKWEPVK